MREELIEAVERSVYVWRQTHFITLIEAVERSVYVWRQTHFITRLAPASSNLTGSFRRLCALVCPLLQPLESEAPHAIKHSYHRHVDPYRAWRRRYHRECVTTLLLLGARVHVGATHLDALPILTC